jgi:pimeloyl-ACP methyl ester carboxylesterase
MMITQLAFLTLFLPISPPYAHVDELPRRGVLGVPLSPLAAELAVKHGLQPGQGLILQKPMPGLTAEKAGLQAGDILLSLDDKPAVAPLMGPHIREVPVGQILKFKVARNGKTLDLSAPLVEKPRDPGNANYEVAYTHVLSHGQRMRTIITSPKKPGKHSALMFIQGFSPVSYDYTLETATGDVQSLDGPILFEFANTGFVTLRVEKPGVGDSEGGPFAQLDYTTELDIYRQALKQLKGLQNVDAENVFIFGHSMGGAFGPMIACEIPVRGLVVYGVAARTWHEYLLDTLRYQGLVGGATFEDADEQVRQGSRLISLVFQENKSVDEVKKSHPTLAPLAEQLFPGGLFNGKSLDFWRQLGQTNFASYWAKCNARVLAVHGASDFVSYEVDHKLIADIVNRANPGWGKSVTAPSSDHLFHNFATEQEALRGYSKGKFTPAFTEIMKAWIEEVRKK